MNGRSGNVAWPTTASRPSAFSCSGRFLILPPPLHHVMRLMRCPILQEETSEGRLVALLCLLLSELLPAVVKVYPLPNYTPECTSGGEKMVQMLLLLGLWVIITTLPLLSDGRFQQVGSGEAFENNKRLFSLHSF